MKKQLMIVGIIVLLISVGLSGCTDNTGSKELSYNELRDHIGKYIDTEITVKGYVSQVFSESGRQVGAFFHESNPVEYPQAALSYIYLFLPGNTTLYTGLYKVTGIVVGTQGIYPFFARINVTSVQVI